MSIAAQPEPNAPGGLSRRALLKTAAWSAPVIAVAAAAPGAAASVTPGVLSITFAAVVAELHWEDVFAGFLYITNTGDTDIVDEEARLDLTGFPIGDTPPVTVEYPSSDVLLDGGEQPPMTVQNSALPLLTIAAGTVVAYSGTFSLAARQTLIIGFYIRRPAFNVVEKVFFVAGHLTIGGSEAEITGGGRLRVDLPDQ